MLEIPNTPASEPRRRAVPRYASELRGHVSNAATGATSNVTLVDLSIAGGRLEGPGLPDAGQVRVLHSEREGRSFRLHCQFVWKRNQQAGVKFTLLDKGTEELLRSICANLRLLPRAPQPS